MIVKDLMKTAVCTEPDESVSKALAKMKKFRINQMPVVNNDLVIGILNLKNVVFKDIDAAKAKVSSFSQSTGTIRSSATIEEAAELLLKSGTRAVPVVDKERAVGIISETDLLKYAFDTTDININDIMSECECVESDDNLGKLKKLMLLHNISRVPVLEKGRPVGIVTTLDLIDTLLGKESFPSYKTGKEGFKQPLPVDKITVKSIMKEPVIVDNDKIKPEMFERSEDILIARNGRLYIITPRDILEYVTSASKKPQGIYLQIINMEGEDEIAALKVNQMATDFVKKIWKMLPKTQALLLYIEKHHKQGKKTKYCVSTRLVGPGGLMISKAWGWNLVTVAQEAVSKLYTEATKKIDRKKDRLTEKATKKFRE